MDSNANGHRKPSHLSRPTKRVKTYLPKNSLSDSNHKLQKPSNGVHFISSSSSPTPIPIPTTNSSSLHNNTRHPSTNIGTTDHTDQQDRLPGSRAIDNNGIVDKNHKSELSSEPLIPVPRLPNIVRDVNGSILMEDDLQIEDSETKSIPISSYNLRGKTFNTNDIITNLNVSPNLQFLYITKLGKVLNNCVINMKRDCRQILLCDKKDTTLIEFEDKKGYMVLRHHPYPEFYKYLQDSFEPVVEPFHALKENMVRIDNERYNSGGGSVYEFTRKVDTKDSNDKNPGFYSTLDPGNSRSSKGAEASKTQDQDGRMFLRLRRTRSENVNYSEVLELETPAPFSPPLKYKLHDGKYFTITYSDFKTLYNNDWVNDNVIDFFINYEIGKAHKEKEAIALNSFFFPKLISTSKDFEEVTPLDYYQNVKRWVKKLDLFNYESLIIPINEKSHWYGCIIVGLKEFLKMSKDIDSKSSQKSEHNSPSDQIVGEFKDLEIKSSQARKFKYKINIFVFDSLGQRHNDIHVPIKSFLIHYCKDKYAEELLPSDIVFRSTKVPKQNNFNDCGIHVIYNIQKFLNETDFCLDLWDKNSDYLSRQFFKSSERSGLRKQLINLLLGLHKEMYGEMPPAKDSKDAEGQDKIEEETNESSSQLEGGSHISINSSLKVQKSSQQSEEDEEAATGSKSPETDTAGNAIHDVSDDEIEVVDVKRLEWVRIEKVNRRGRGQGKLLVTVTNGVNSQIKDKRPAAEDQNVSPDSTTNNISNLVNGISDRTKLLEEQEKRKTTRVVSESKVESEDASKDTGHTTIVLDGKMPDNEPANHPTQEVPQEVLQIQPKHDHLLNPISPVKKVTNLPSKLRPKSQIPLNTKPPLQYEIVPVHDPGDNENVHLYETSQVGSTSDEIGGEFKGSGVSEPRVNEPEGGEPKGDELKGSEPKESEPKGSEPKGSEVKGGEGNEANGHKGLDKSKPGSPRKTTTSIRLSRNNQDRLNLREESKNASDTEDEKGEPLITKEIITISDVPISEPICLGIRESKTSQDMSPACIYVINQIFKDPDEKIDLNKFLEILRIKRQVNKLDYEQDQAELDRVISHYTKNEVPKRNLSRPRNEHFQIHASEFQIHPQKRQRVSKQWDI